MDFRLPTELRAFQETVRQFIANDLPADWDTARDDDERVEIQRAVMQRLAARRWLALAWPKDLGGSGAPPLQQMAYNEIMSYHRVPGFSGHGVGWVGPTIMLYGSDEQKQRYLSRIADGSDLWCTLYSEPGAGSDLASLQTRAVRDGDEYVINGQKIWTSGGHQADWGWLAARTDSDAPKHKGITTFVLDMKSPGITIRPLTNMGGSHEFNEVFFEDVRVPASQLVGQENRGWYQLAVGLDFERSSIAAASGARRDLDELLQYCRDTTRSGQPIIRDPVTAQQIAELYVGANVGRLMSYNVAWMQTRGGIPNREANITKLYMAELQQRLQYTAMRIIGLAGTLGPGSSHAAMGGHLQYRFLRSIANTIEGGTSEIQRNVIATRGLELPRG